MHRATMFAAALMFALPATALANAQAEAEHRVQREFRFFRIQVYNSFRSLRPEYDTRRQTGEAALDAWKQAGSPVDHAPTLSQWYRDAKHASLPGLNLPLPPLPEFPAAVVSQPVKQSPASESRDPFDPPEKQASTAKHKRYHVREVATRSTLNPFDPPTTSAQREQADQTTGKQPGTSLWQSFSRVLFPSRSLQATPEKASP